MPDTVFVALLVALVLGITLVVNLLSAGQRRQAAESQRLIDAASLFPGLEQVGRPTWTAQRHIPRD